MASVYENFQSYMKPVLKQNSQKLELLQGGFNGYRMLTDGNGEVFFGQAVRYMRETLGKSGGTDPSLENYRTRKRKTEAKRHEKESRRKMKIQ